MRAHLLHPRKADVRQLQQQRGALRGVRAAQAATQHGEEQARTVHKLRRRAGGCGAGAMQGHGGALRRRRQLLLLLHDACVGGCAGAGGGGRWTVLVLVGGTRAWQHEVCMEGIAGVELQALSWCAGNWCGWQC